MRRLLAGLMLPALMLLVGAMSEAASKDGPRRWTKTLKKKTTMEYKIAFLAGTAEFSVIGDGSTDVDIYVVDKGNQAIAKDVELTDLAMVRWNVPSPQTYTIRVVNLGDEDNECTMGHN